MTPTTFQLARHLNHTRQIVTGQRCPCGNKAVKKDGASWVCVECLRRDQVVIEIHAAAQIQHGPTMLTAEEFEASKENQKAYHWRYRQRVKQKGSPR